MIDDLAAMMIGLLVILGVGIGFVDCNRHAYERQCDESGGRYVDSICVDTNH